MEVFQFISVRSWKKDFDFQFNFQSSFVYLDEMDSDDFV